MNNQEFLEQIEKSQKEGLALIGRKNADYADEENPFKSFNNIEAICDISCEKGLLVRMSDKLTRIGNLLDRDARVTDETIEDTLLDLANYAYILLAKIKTR